MMELGTVEVHRNAAVDDSSAGSGRLKRVRACVYNNKNTFNLTYHKTPTIFYLAVLRRGFSCCSAGGIFRQAFPTHPLASAIPKI